MMQSVKAIVLGVVGALSLTFSVHAQTPAKESKPSDAKPAETAPVDNKAPSRALSEMEIGSPDAKVTVIEYASMTCSHCARFHTQTYEPFKKAYVDTGKVRYIFREFPLDPLAAAGSMLARCAAEEKTTDQYFAVVDLLFQQQNNWAFVDKPLDALLQTVRQAGFSQEKAESCLKRQDIYDRVNASKKQGTDAGVESTPTFFINGTKHNGALRLEELTKIIDPLVKE
jgi:protein-disulfide isomerase